MNFNKYVAAIEISSSKIVGVVGTYEAGHLNIIAADQAKNDDNVRYGHIQNLEDTSNRLAHVLARLEREMEPNRIRSVYVGLSGRSMKSIETTVALTLPEDTEVNDEILARLRSEALATSIDSSLEVVDAVPRIYKVGTQETTNPRGVVGNHIEGTFDLIVCRPTMTRNLKRTLPEKLGINIAGTVVTPLAVGTYILTEDERRLGCMLVDMGAETTTVLIYKGGYLRYFATIPLGGRHITRDITTLHQLEERSEEIKKQSGTAILRENSTSNIVIHGLKLADVNNLIVARAEEIVANVVEQITYAGMREKDLAGGIVLVGGGAYLNGMDELLERQSGMTVKMGRYPTYIRVDAPGASNNLIQVACVAYAGASSGDAVCLEAPAKEELPASGEPNEPEEPRDSHDARQVAKKGANEIKKKGSRFFDSIKERISTMFGSDEDESDLLD